jgi:2-dehydro-3-deoxyphosphogluconate aldolase / (4S)-4-hydroxy-2-oxoglutarate aldolase
VSAQETFEQVRASGVIGIVRTQDEHVALDQARRAIQAGLPVVEVSLTTPGGLSVIETLAGEGHDAVVGAGTVLDAATVDRVVDAGGTVIVSPNFEPAVVEAAVRRGVAVFPGCLTPTEMVHAMALGATAVKIVPAHLWSPAALAGMLQALPQLPCVPTGGVGPDDLGEWIRAGAVAAGIGSALTAAADPAPVVRRLQEAVAEARAS